MTKIRRVHIMAARLRLKILNELRHPVDEKTRKLAALDIDNPIYSQPQVSVRWQDNAADIFRARIEKVLELHLGPHMCVGSTIDHPCRTYRILRGHEDA